MFFLSILIMLFFSTGIITYTGLFHSREGVFLLSTPATTDRIFAYKFAEAVAMSSWGFFLLGSPLMVAYGLTVKAPIGVLRHVPGLSVHVRHDRGQSGCDRGDSGRQCVPETSEAGAGGRGHGDAGGTDSPWPCGSGTLRRHTLTSDWLGSVQERLAFCQHPLWPSRWMSAGLLASARGDWPRAGYYLMVLSAHAGLGYLVAAAVARDLYFRGFNRVQGGRSSRRRLALDALDHLFHRGFFFLSRPVRLLILKDLRTFIRDPAQWSQFLIFFGLLAFYFLNIPRLGYGIQSPSWRNLISFLNLAVTALILSTFTSRFIFPLLSLEGRNFWVLGLLPLRPRADPLGQVCLLGRHLAGGDRGLGFLEFDLKPFFENPLLPILQPDPMRGGLTELRKIATLADTWGMTVAPHLFPELNVQLLASIPNGLWIEDMGISDDLWIDPVPVVNATITAPERPGHGLAFRPEILRDCAVKN